MEKFSRIAVVDNLNNNILDYAKEEIRTLSEAPVSFPEDVPKTEEEIIKRIEGADCILLSYQSVLTKRIMDRCPNLRYIGTATTTLAHLPVEEIRRRGIALTSVKNYAGEATAEYIFMQLLMLLRGLHGHHWKMAQSELNGKTIGIIGVGDVGGNVALRALGFNMRVLYFQRSRNLDWEAKGLTYTPFMELLQNSDIITISVSTNTHILNMEEFDAIKEGAILVNTTLGKVFDAEDFLRWINKGKNYAIFDADAETSEIKHAKNIIIGNQEAGRTLDAQDRLSTKFVNNIKTYLDSI
jgi:lactate dehydrogenase-like 2-hydroxyacid dehydrogenase